MSKIAIITGDIINSRHLETDWMTGLTELLSKTGKQEETWDIYRGDEYQVKIAPAESLLFAIRLKSYLRSIKADARMAIGIGEQTTHFNRLSENNGSAFIRSGECFGTLKTVKTTLAVSTGDTRIDYEFNLMLRFALTIMDNWLAQPAEYVSLALDYPQWQQEEIGRHLSISQAAVSRRRKRSQFDLILELDHYFREKIKPLI